MKVSVITCTRNSQATLADTLKSIVQQDYFDVEHIVVDGGSTDATLDIVARYSPKSIVVHETGRGISSAMNDGIIASTGDLICHLHSDDYFYNNKVLSNVVDLINNSDCDWLFGGICSDVDGEILFPAHKKITYTYAALVKRNFIPHPATFIRRRVFDEVGVFDDGLNYAMDYDLFLRIAKKYNPIQVDDVYSVFRRHAGSATHSNLRASFEEDFLVRLRYASFPLGYFESWVRYFVRKYKLRGAL